MAAISGNGDAECSGHDVMKICGRILSNIPQGIHVFEVAAGTTARKLSSE